MTIRVVQELERRGFGPTLSRWAAHTIETQGLQYTAQALALTLYDVHQNAQTDEHNHVLLTQALARTSSKRRSSSPTG